MMHKFPTRRFTSGVLVLAILLSIGLPIGVYGADPLCGLEEHTHTEACYLVPGSLTYSCTDESIGLHHHDDSCYDEEGNTVCGYSDFVIHTHDDLCYDANGTLICTLEEHELHQHDEACYTEEKVLVCSEQEDPGHQHTEACYTETKTLVCEIEESEGHVHAEGCFADCMENHEHSAVCASCGLQETVGHQHGDLCYVSEKTLVCEQEETPAGHVHDDACYQTEPVLSCGYEEAVLHSHTAACFDSGVYESGSLICGYAELFEHQHTDACVYITDPVASEEPICGLVEHFHNDACYETPDENEEDSTRNDDAEPRLYIDNGYVCVNGTETYAIDDFESATGALVTFVLADGDNVYDVLTGELPDNFCGPAELSIYLEFLSAQIQAFGDQCYLAFTGISLDEPVYDTVTDNDGNEVGSFIVDTDGSIYIMLNEAGQALDTLSFFHSYDVIVSSGADVSIVGLDENFNGGDLIVCKTDYRNEAPLYGAQFALYEDANASTLYQSGRTTTTLFGGATNETVFRDLQPGSYYLVETVAPEGCVRDEQVYTSTVGDDYTISTYPELETVDVNTTYSMDEESLGSFAVKFSNQPSISELYIKVIDKTTKKIIPGFKFSMYRDESLTRLVSESETASDGSAFFGNWRLGETFYVKETTTPDGYLPDGTIYAVTSIGGNEFTSVPEGLVATSNAFEPTSDDVKSVGTLQTPRAAQKNVALSIDKKLTNNFPVGNHKFQFQIEYDLGDGNGVQTETQAVTATVAKDGSYTFDTEALFGWFINAGDISDKTITFTLKELQPSDSCVIIPDYWYEGTICHSKPQSADPNSLDDGVATAALSPNILTIDIDKIFENGDSEDFYDYSEIWTGAEQEVSLPFENDYFIPDDNVSFPIQKTLTDNFPAGEYEFTFQLDYTRNGTTYTETQTVTATVAEDGSYTFDSEAIFGWFIDTNEREVEDISFVLKELQPADSNVITPQYWYEGTITRTYPAGPLSLDDGIAPANYYFGDITVEVVKKHESDDVPDEEVVAEKYLSWSAHEPIAFDLSFENAYVTPPTITKQVLENDKVSGSAQWSQFTTADSGDSIRYKLTGTMPSNLADYETYEYSFYDTSYSLLVDETSFEVTIDGKNVDESDYSLTVAPKGDNCWSSVKFTDVKAVMDKLGVTSGADAVIEIQYTAKYKEKSAISTFANVVSGSPGNNTAHITTESLSRSEDVTANVYSFNVIVDKVDEEGTALPGALFKLQKLNASTDEYEDYQAHTDTDTSFVFDGLSAGSYRLIETTVPEGGYAKMDPLDFTIVCGENFDTDKTDYEISYDQHRSDIGMSFSFNENLGQGDITFFVTNYANPIEVKKEVLEFNDDDPDNQVWQSWATHDMGDIVEYKITGTLPGWVGTRTTFPLTIHDRFERTYNYLPILNTDSIEVYLAGKLVPETEYSLSLLEACTDGCAFDIVFADILATMDNLGVSKTKGSELVVTYDVTLGTDWKPLALTSAYDVAPVDDGDDEIYYGDINVTWFEYLNASGFTTITDYAQTAVYSIDVLIYKNDENEYPLAGAEFKLQKWDGTKFVDRSVSDEYTSDGTTLYFYGLDVGKYRIIETKAPEGYQQAADITFEFDLEPNDDRTANVTFLSDDSEYGANFIDGGFIIDFCVVNYPIEYLPKTLPNTGGMGTYLFYGTGSILLVGIALLILKKQKNDDD